MHHAITQRFYCHVGLHDRLPNGEAECGNDFTKERPLKRHKINVSTTGTMIPLQKHFLVDYQLLFSWIDIKN
jgi:hypothetical protein